MQEKENILQKNHAIKDFSQSLEFYDIEKTNLLDDFPKLSFESILENITCGSYQLK